MPAGCGLGKALDNRISRLLLTGKVDLAFGDTPTSGWWTGARAQGGLVHTINSASELRAIDKHLTG